MGLIPTLTQIVSGDADDPTRDMSNWNAIRNVVNGNITNTNIGDAAAIAISKTALVTFIDWTISVPTWTAASGSPAKGDGTLTGYYTQIGKLVTYTVILTTGSTTNFGTGIWTFTLPVTAHNNAADSGVAYALDSGTAYRAGTVLMVSTTTVNIYNDNNLIPWGATSPMTWANGDRLRFTITYRAA